MTNAPAPLRHTSTATVPDVAAKFIEGLASSRARISSSEPSENATKVKRRTFRETTDVSEDVRKTDSITISTNESLPSYQSPQLLTPSGIAAPGLVTNIRLGGYSSCITTPSATRPIPVDAAPDVDDEVCCLVMLKHVAYKSG